MTSECFNCRHYTRIRKIYNVVYGARDYTIPFSLHRKLILEKAFEVSNLLSKDSYPRKTIFTRTMAIGYFAVIYTLQRVTRGESINAELAFIHRIIRKFLDALFKFVSC